MTRALRVKLKVPVMEAFQLTRKTLNSSPKNYPAWVRKAYSARGRLQPGEWGERLKPTGSGETAIFCGHEQGLIEIPIDSYLMAKDGEIQGVCPEDMFKRDFEEVAEAGRIITLYD